MENFDIDFYKKSHNEFNNFSNNQLIIHWLKFGKTHAKLPNKNFFYTKFPDFNWKLYKSYNLDLEKKGYTTEELLITHYWEIGQFEKRKYTTNKTLNSNIERFKNNLIKNKNIIFTSSNEIIINVDFNNDFKINMIKNKTYIIVNKNSFLSKENIDKLKNMNTRNNHIFFLQGENDKIFVIVHKSVNNGLFSVLDVLKLRKTTINYEIIGYNSGIFDISFYYKLYFYYGLLNIDLNFLGHENNKHYFDLINDFNHKNIYKYKYDYDIIFKFYYYKCGKSLENPSIDKLKSKISKHNVNLKTEKCLLFSKKIIGYGGNQKTSLQLIELLDKYYFVKIISNDINDNDEFSYKNDFLINDISNDKIIKLKKKNDILDYIHHNNFKFIINNKLNEFFDIIDKINNPYIFIITKISKIYI